VSTKKTKKSKSAAKGYSGLLGKPKLVWAVILAFTFCLYANTLTHGYVQDDAIVIYDNMFTTQGVQGIPGLLKYDTFYGFFKEAGKANLVSGGRYRPLTPVMFAIGWSVFGDRPFIGHLNNILLYGLIGIILYELIRRFAPSKKFDWRIIGFLTALLFIAHPVHTEVVANIKGRDEIVSLLGSLLSLFSIWKAIDTKKMLWYGLAAVSIFLACLSKENAVTYLAAIPLVLIFFKKIKIGHSVRYLLFPLIGILAFIAIRSIILGFDFGASPNELMNNPFIKVEGNQYIPFSASERMATIIFTLGKYVQLLFFPHPLTHDYYPRHIDIMTFSDPSVWLSIVMYVVLIAYAIIGFSKKSVLSFGIIYYFITLSIVSNVVFPIGTNMSERFLFMPSIGFCLIIAHWLSLIKNKKLFYSLAGILLLLFSIKTISRNLAWKSDYILFNTDKHVSKNSAKLNNAVAGTLTTEYLNTKDENVKAQMLNEAIEACDRALSIHPNYKNAFLIKANALHYKKDYQSAELNYQKALSIDPDFTDAISNSAINYREHGRYYGESLGELSKSIEYLNRALSINAEDYETLRLLGTAHGFSGDVSQSINFFTKALALEPNLAGAHVNLGKAYMNAGNQEEGQRLLNKAIELDPNALNE